VLLLSGDVHLNPGPVCQLHEVCKVIQRSWIVHCMVRFSLLVFLNVINGRMYFSCELLWPCCVMVFPVWFSTKIIPVTVNYSSAILPQFVERCSETYYELSESDSEGEQGRTGETRQTVYTGQFPINLRRSSTKLDDSIIGRLHLLGIIRRPRCRGNRAGRCIQERRSRSRFLQLTDIAVNSVASPIPVIMGRRSAKPIQNKLPSSECERVLETVHSDCSAYPDSNESNTPLHCFVINARSLKKD
jgi:hypothetical protein